ncbi:MAG: ABC transporter ATP-binding protein [Actinobacteria bacterium]|nr:ABC transporter ATP-binding protein [Actinomycetota bacterium]
MSRPVVSISGLSKAYNLYEKPLDMVLESILGGVRHDVFWALHDVSLQIQEGDRVGIVGPNGAGKSTLLKLITGNLKPTRGSIEVNGKVSALLSLASFLDPEQTGVENIRFNLVMGGVPRRDIPGLIEEITDFTELGAFIHAPVKTYSSGMTARLSFSISTAITPDILIVDEVLGAGDAYFAAKATLRMFDLCRQGRALLFVSHSPTVVQMLCNRAVWLDGGAIRAVGTADEIVKAYEADFRRQEDESVRAGNRERATARLNAVLAEEVSAGAWARARLTGPGGRITDTHYVRRIALETGGQEQEIPLELLPADTDLPARLDITASEWGRPHDRRGVQSRALQPSSHPLRGGHILVRAPEVGEPPTPFRLTVESTTISGKEPLKLQLADAEERAWVDQELVSTTPFGGDWVRAVFTGKIAPRAEEQELHSIVSMLTAEGSPDLEIVDVQFLVDGEESSRVREKVPFAIQVNVRAHREVPLADVSLKILKADGTYVFWQSSGQVGGNLRHVTGDRRLTFHFDPNPFGSDTYEVTVESHNGFDLERNWPYSQVFDRRVGALRFTVDREWPLLMLGPVNQQFPVTVEAPAADKPTDEAADEATT